MLLNDSVVLAARAKKAGSDVDHDDVVQIKEVLHPDVRLYEQDGPPPDDAPLPAALRWARLASVVHTAADPAAVREFEQSAQMDSVKDEGAKNKPEANDSAAVVSE